MTDFLTYEERLNYILYLVERKSTGTPSELAERLNVSKRTVKRMIETLRLKGNDIIYCRTIQSYKILSD